MGNDFKFLKGNIETIILNALYNGDKYGYEIAKEIKEKTENKYEIKQPTLYGYLKRLEDQDLVEFYWGEESHGGRRKYFRLTSHGKSTCEQYLSEWNFHRNILDSLMPEQNAELPEYTPQDNVFLGSKSSKKRKSKKDFNFDEAQNQQLFAELLKISQSPNEEIEENEDSSVESPCADNNISAVSQDEFEKQVESFNDEQIFDSQPDFEQENTDFSVEIVENNEIIAENNDEINSVQFVENESTLSAIETEVQFEDSAEKSFEQISNEPVLTQPIIERKAGDVAETEIASDFSCIDTDYSNNLIFEPVVEENQPTEYDNLIKNDIFDASVDYQITENVASTTVSSPITEENETEAQYKQILNSLLGDQIVDADEKIAQISPQISYYNEEPLKKDLTMTEMADSLAKEGYRIRFYNTATSQYKAVPMLIKNKINCVTAWSTLIAFYALLGLSWLICGSAVSVFGICATAFVLLLVPSYFTYLYITKPNIKIKSTHNFKQSIISKLIIFLLLSVLIVITDFVLLKLDVSNPADVMHKFIIPELVALTLIISEIFYNVFLKQKTFYC